MTACYTIIILSSLCWDTSVIKPLIIISGLKVLFYTYFKGNVKVIVGLIVIYYNFIEFHLQK